MVDRKRLNYLLAQAAKHKMTPGEIWDQRVSWVFGQLMDTHPDVTRAEVVKRIEAHYGPRPVDEPAE